MEGGPDAGDAAAPPIEQQIAANRQRVERLAHRLNGWSDDTQDIVQEVMVRALIGAGKFRGNAEIETWLTRITINCCRSHQRKRWLARMLTRRTPTGTDSTTDIIDAIATKPEQSDSPTENDETAAAVRNAVEQLGPRYREPVVLHYLEGMEVERVASLLGVSPNAVSVRLYRARTKLRTLLDDLI